MMAVIKERNNRNQSINETIENVKTEIEIDFKQAIAAIERKQNNLLSIDEFATSRVSFSVIMPVYNRSYCIKRAIDSLLSQTYQNFELIIIDDGSTDNTEEIVKSTYKKQLDNGLIKFYKEKNGGVSKARNYALKVAKNDWIAYLDSDNYMCKNFLQLFAQKIEEFPNFMTFNAKLMRAGDKLVIGEKYDSEKILKENTIDLGCYVHNRMLYSILGGFDERMARLVDWDLITRYSKKFPPLFIDNIVEIYDDSRNRERITSNSDLLLANRNIFYSKHCTYPTITTIIVTYNHVQYIRQAIESALMQNGEFIHEVIISDDGSTDGTHEIIKEYANRFKGVIIDLSSNENVGISQNYRKCFKASHGDYIAILEGDDYWIDNRKLEYQKRFLEKNSDCSMVFNGIQILDSGSIKEHPLRKKLPSKIIGQDLLERGESLIANFSCCMYRGHLIKNMPDLLYEYRLSELVVAFYFEKYGRIGYINSDYTVYRIRNDSVWSGASEYEKLIQQKKVREIALKICDNIYVKQFQNKIVEIDEKIEQLQKLEQEEHNKQLLLIKKSELFNAEWYRNEYKLSCFDDPVEHYLKPENKYNNPSPLFNNSEYLSLYFDVLERDINPLVHYERYGRNESRAKSWDEAIDKFFKNSDENTLNRYIENEIYISVIVTSYNYEDYILETLESLIQQTYRFFEIIIVDDGSCDNSINLIREFQKKNTNLNIPIRLFTHMGGANMGMPASVVLGIENARGRYVAFCESDDLWTVDHLEKIVEVINKSKNNACIIANDVEIFGSYERALHLEQNRAKMLKHMNKAINWITPQQFRKGNEYILTLSAVCIRIDYLQKCNFGIVGTPECLDWWIYRQVCYDTPIFYINKQITKWRAHDSYMVVRNKKTMYEKKAELNEFLNAEDAIMRKLYPNDKRLNFMNDDAERVIHESDIQKQKKDETEKIYEMQNLIDELNSNIAELRKSYTYKLGRIITFLPRLLRHVIMNKPM